MDKKIRVVLLSRFSNQVNRGVESFVSELSERLKKEFDVSILTNKDSDSLKKILGGGYDVVIPCNGRFQALKASLGRLIGGYKIIIVGHAGIGKDEIFNILTVPNAYVGLTKFETKWISRFNLFSKLLTIPNGVDLSVFKPQGEKIKFDLESPIILSVGALDWYKYHDKAIEAVSKLDHGSLLIVGAGSEKDKLTTLGEKLLGNKRFKLTKLDYSEMPSLYRSVDLFTLPSWDREAFGRVYLEAMATNLAVVAPNDQTRREIVGNSGILVDCQNIDEYSKALNNALNEDWGNKPIKQAEKFSWDQVAMEYIKLIKSL